MYVHRYYAPGPRPIGKGQYALLLSVRLSVCLSVCLSVRRVGYIANNSRTQRPSVPKFLRKVPHLRIALQFQGQSQTVKGQGHQAH